MKTNSTATGSRPGFEFHCYHQSGIRLKWGLGWVTKSGFQIRIKFCSKGHMTSLTTSHSSADKFSFNSNAYFCETWENFLWVCYCCVSFVSFGKSNFYWIIQTICFHFYHSRVFVSIASVSCQFWVAVDLLFMSSASGSRVGFHIYCQWQ